MALNPLPAELDYLSNHENRLSTVGLVRPVSGQNEKSDCITFRDARRENSLKENELSYQAQIPQRAEKYRSFSKAKLEDLPNELLDHIISFLNTEPPSVRKIKDEPSLDLTVSKTKDLKHLSLTSQIIRKLLLPRLFRCSRVKTICNGFCVGDSVISVPFFLDNVESFLSFLRSNNLLGYVKSLVVYINETPTDTLQEQSTLRKTRVIWRHIFPHLNPHSITIVGPPVYLARLISCEISTCDAWAFDMPLHILRLEQPAGRSMAPGTTHNKAAGLLDARPWTHMSLDEGSSLKAYRSYEYYLKITPSLLGTRPRECISEPLLAMTSLTCLHYTAVFPFYSHTDDVLQYAKAMPALEKLSMQLAPSVHSDIFSDRARTALVNLEDSWMEVEMGYSLIGHAVMEMGEKGKLTEFETLDYEIRDFRWTIASKFRDTMKGWKRYGGGRWRKVGSLWFPRLGEEWDSDELLDWGD
ncbi:MAG: hypothetical protein M1830_009284 [Pleopsidium flavum]|nr:MAG: hypothetical protein M1830_009284 [Pleopsidium flavum]